ncbi:hypothetical protein QA584_01085 [Anaerocolumna sp. AGMB13025]|uniref:hypothetical protein n=1 Tax=Anaerocolumna sp. AGMB13025 TaxID=3039116 RepID=UPI00241E0AAF|nr:hypothetical protein [Anaerocolumna sp. AGMB13025]WFR57704.1 hypothetical protein QA584_01085 [Anaerocolumna sp. AGMB13025]
MKKVFTYIVTIFIGVFYILFLGNYGNDIMAAFSEVILPCVCIGIMLTEQVLKSKKIYYVHEYLKIKKIDDCSLNKHDRNYIINIDLDIDKTITAKILAKKKGYGETCLDIISLLLSILAIVVIVARKQITITSLISYSIFASTIINQVITNRENKSEIFFRYVEINKNDKDESIKNNINALFLENMTHIIINNDFYDFMGKKYFIIIYRKIAAWERFVLSYLNVCVEGIAFYLMVRYAWINGLMSVAVYLPILLPLFVWCFIDGKEFQDRVALKQVHVSKYSKSWIIDYDIDEMMCLEINEEKYNMAFEKIGKFKAMKLYANYRNKRY